MTRRSFLAKIKNFFVEDGIRVKCRHTSVLCAYAASEYFINRIAIGKTALGVRHAQAQALVYGKWTWLRFDGAYVCIANKELKTIDKFVTLDQAVDGALSIPCKRKIQLMD